MEGGVNRKKIRRYLAWYRTQETSGWANRINSTPLADMQAYFESRRNMPMTMPQTYIVLPERMRSLFHADDPYLSSVRFI